MDSELHLVVNPDTESERGNAYTIVGLPGSVISGHDQYLTMETDDP